MSGRSNTNKGRRGSGRPSRGSRGRQQPPSRRSGSKENQGSQRESGRESGGDDRRRGDGPARRDLRGPARDLPRWVVDALTRVTSSRNVAAALEELGEASRALSEGRFHPTLRHALRAKELSPRDATVREVIGLASYRLGDWGTALRELRTYRRLAGEVTHLPVEMDTLRAMGREPDVEKAWAELRRLARHPSVLKEGAVVYASHLIDEGRIADARKVVDPGKLTNNPHPEDLRVWYVAARCAALDGDAPSAVRFRDAILTFDPGFPGMDELDGVISAAG